MKVTIELTERQVEYFSSGEDRLDSKLHRQVREQVKLQLAGASNPLRARDTCKFDEAAGQLACFSCWHEIAECEYPDRVVQPEAQGEDA